MTKKTIKVEDLRIQINDFLRTETAPHTSKIARRAQARLLESILMVTGNYHGFRYLCLDEVPKGELPGINKLTTQCVTEISNDILFDENLTDTTRVQYF